MSWTVSCMGIKEAVRPVAAMQFSNINCQEPEQTLKNQAAALVDALLAAQPDGIAVKVEASGSANAIAVYGDPANPTKLTGWQQTQQTLSAAVTPLWGFVS